MKNLRAFSLVELSIVLVILGLLVGGILAGKSLIRASELRSMPTDVNKYMTAMHAFRDKYFAMPGDMSNATNFWGTAATCPGDFSTPSSTATTCNGNSNSQMSWTESWRAWQHLSNAGLVEGTYTGVPGSISDSTFGTAGLNMPASRVSATAGYAFTWIGSRQGEAAYFDGSYNHSLLYGNGNGVDNAPGLFAHEAWNIDVKMDDGKPGTGKMRTRTNSSRSQCASNDNPATAVYMLESIANYSCNLYFITGF